MLHWNWIEVIVIKDNDAFAKFTHHFKKIKFRNYHAGWNVLIRQNNALCLPASEKLRVQQLIEHVFWVLQLTDLHLALRDQFEPMRDPLLTILRVRVRIHIQVVALSVVVQALTIIVAARQWVQAVQHVCLGVWQWTRSIVVSWYYLIDFVFFFDR